MKKFVYYLLAVFFFLAPFGSWVYSIVMGIKFDHKCGDYLKLASNANSIELAEKHLTTAINYLEKNDITHGCNKVFIYKPHNDIGLWYENLKSAQKQLQDIQAKGDVSDLEESNMLMKLRESLLEDDGSLTLPMGISRSARIFKITFWCNVLGGAFFIPAFIFLFKGLEEM